MQTKQDISYSLISAVRAGALERVTELINSYGLCYSQAWAEGYVLLREAVQYNHVEVAKLLIKSGSKVNSKNKMHRPSDTPLHFAAINGDVEIVRMILDKGGNINAINRYGKTPLHNAIANTNVEVTESLLNHRAYVNARDSYGTSPLHAAVEIGHLKIVEHLLKYGANVGDIKGEDNRTPLHIAAERGYISIAECLLNHGACINSSTLKSAYTPLHFASASGKEEMVKLFLNKGADINSLPSGNLTPLHIATTAGHETVVRLLLEHGAEVDSQGKDGKTVLHLAVEKGYSWIAKEVLKYCPDINNQSNRSSLHTAVHRHEKNAIVEALLAYGFNVNPEDVNNPELLHAAVKKGYLKIVEDLLKYGADVNMLHNSPFKGFTALHSAAKYKQEDSAKLLISYGADINAQDKTGKTPIFYAIENADFKITKLLLTNGAHIKDNPELLNIAVKKGYIEIVEVLLQHDADINASDEYGRTALHLTTLSDVFDFFGEDPDVINVKGEIAKLLLGKGADVDAQTKKGVTTLHAAIKKGYVEVVEALLEFNANVNCGVGSGITPLHLSAQCGNEEISTMLFNKGANVNAMAKCGYTALLVAIHNGHEGVVKVLLECGAKVNFKIKSDYTPLHVAAQNCNVVITETLLKFGADINSRDEHGRTALHIASKKGHCDVVRTLLEYGSDINATSRSNYTPLDYAVVGIRLSDKDTFKRYSFDDDFDFVNDGREIQSGEATVEALERHIVKMKTANLYVSEKNLLSISGEMSDFQYKCKKEIAGMKSEKINNANISFYDILAKGTSSLAINMRNENIVQALKADEHKTKFPIYASMIERNFRMGMERRELLEQGNNIFHFLFELPHDCIEKIFSYLSNQDLSILIDACKPDIGTM